MLYDPKWEVKADPFDLRALIAWLEKQPANKTYDFYCAGECMVGQWVKSIDPDATTARDLGWGSSFYYVHGKVVDLGSFVDIANSEECKFTFGAALKRAQRALRGQA